MDEKHAGQRPLDVRVKQRKNNTNQNRINGLRYGTVVYSMVRYGTVPLKSIPHPVVGYNSWCLKSTFAVRNRWYILDR